MGHIGEADVSDCIELVKLAISKYSVIDEERIGIFGGSHGGYLGAWLISKIETKSFFKAAALRNPVVHLPAMILTTEIPEWGYACAFNRESDWPTKKEDMVPLYEKSPASQFQNI